MKYGIEVGQIWIAADGSKCGHLVIDTESFGYCDDIVTRHFTPQYIGSPDNRIDAFKLSQVRYYLPDVLPEWVPEMLRATQTTSPTPDPTST